MKGTFREFFRSKECGLLYFLVFFSLPVAATVDLIVSRFCPKWSTSNSNGAIGPIRDTIKPKNVRE